MSCDLHPRCVSIATLFGVAILVGCTGAGSSGESGSKARAAETAAGEVEIRDIPAGDAATLLKFIEALADEEPQGSGAELDAQIVKALNTMLEASRRLLDAKPNEEQFAQAHFYQLQALKGLRFMGQPRGAENYDEAVQAAMNDSNLEIARLGWKEFLDAKLATWPSLSKKSKAALADKVIAMVRTDKPTWLDVRIVGMLANNLDRRDDEFVHTLVEATLPTFKESDDPEVRETLEQFSLEGVDRRLNLVGNPVEVSGQLLTGGEIDWNDYKGKVVLIDFGASWCPECVKEAPNVADLYASYRDKGFEVISVSLDKTPEKAEMYAVQTKCEWATIVPKEEGGRYLRFPMAEYYGVNKAPTMILVGRDGKVIDTHAPGRKLREYLRQLLGEPSIESPKPTVGPQPQAG